MRQTGRTTKQLGQMKQGDAFICLSSKELEYCRAIVHQVFGQHPKGYKWFTVDDMIHSGRWEGMQRIAKVHIDHSIRERLWLSSEHRLAQFWEVIDKLSQRHEIIQYGMETKSDVTS